MSKYTTGEIARLCGVSVRTVQYYDTRGILTPCELSEGGRRLYSEDDLKQMKIICFLRELNIPISSIGELLAEEHPENVISLLLDEQEKTLRAEINERQSQLDKLNELRRAVKAAERFSVKSMMGIANIMKSRKKLRRVRTLLIVIGVIMDIIQIGTLILWIQRGVWAPFAVGMAVVIALGIWASVYYYEKTAYICPECHTVFRSKFIDAFSAMHTPHTRKLVCTACGRRGYCVETHREAMEDG